MSRSKGKTNKRKEILDFFTFCVQKVIDRMQIWRKKITCYSYHRFIMIFFTYYANYASVFYFIAPFPGPLRNAKKLRLRPLTGFLIAGFFIIFIYSLIEFIQYTVINQLKLTQFGMNEIQC